MSYSPFVTQYEKENLWVLWEKRAPVLESLEKQTDSRLEERSLHHSMQQIQLSGTQPRSIERRQYLSVLNRMHQAAGKTGAFSKWDSDIT